MRRINIRSGHQQDVTDVLCVFVLVFDVVKLVGRNVLSPEVDRAIGDALTSAGGHTAAGASSLERVTSFLCKFYQIWPYHRELLLQILPDLVTLLCSYLVPDQQVVVSVAHGVGEERTRDASREASTND